MQKTNALIKELNFKIEVKKFCLEIHNKKFDDIAKHEVFRINLENEIKELKIKKEDLTK